LLGSNVLFPTFFDGSGNPLVATYTVGPSPAGGGRLANTIYIALDSIAPSLNPNGTAALGVVVFPGPAPAPQITFEGANTLPGFEPENGGPIQVPSTAEPITLDNITLVNSFSSDEDTDNDLVGDDIDNCVQTQNGPPGGQEDRGGVASAVLDFIGDACQCGDFSGDGIVDDTVGENDVDGCQQVLALPPGAVPGDPSAASRCSVSGNTQFDIVDIIVMELETNEEDSGLNVALGDLQVCSPAVELQ
jgi:hypothetical protein